MTLQIKLIILAIVAAAFLGLAWTSKHYHGAYIEVREQLAAQKISLDQALAAAKACSEGTKKVSDATVKKEADVKVEVDKAKVIRKEKDKIANDILVSKPSVPSDYCKSAEELIIEYKNTKAQK